MPLSRKLAFINLSTQEVTIQEIPLVLRENYLGGRGLNGYFLTQLAKPGLDPFDPANPLIFGAGLLTGVFGGRLNVSGKAPESGYLGDSSVGGYFGAELADTGLSHLIISGRSTRPVYLYLENERVSFRNASHLWGKTTGETQTVIRSELKDKRIKIMVIGPAGENRVRFACILTGLKNAAGRTGMGALMGSKNLKAVAVRGNRGYAVKSPADYLNLLRATNRKINATGWSKALGVYGTPLLFKNANTMGFTSYKYHQQTTVGEAGEELYAENLREKYSQGMVSCYGCSIHCRHRYELKEGEFKGTRGEGPEYASITALGPTLGNLSLESVIYLSELCNKYGVDTISGGNYLGFAFTLFQKGLISDREVGYELKWGDHRAIERLLLDTIYRRGFGDVVAEGSFAYRKLKTEAKQYLLVVKNVSMEQTDERPVKAFALGMGVASRGACHMRSRPSIDVVRYPRDLLEKFYGGEVGKDFRDYHGKARLVWWHEIFNAVADSVGICRFASVFSSVNAVGYLDIGKFLEATVGFAFTDQDLARIGERIYTGERLFLIQEGVSRKDDYLPDLYYDVPIPAGPAQGDYIDRPSYETMLDEYYQLHGWDRQGIPTTQTLTSLNLNRISGKNRCE